MWFHECKTCIQVWTLYHNVLFYTIWYVCFCCHDQLGLVVNHCSLSVGAWCFRRNADRHHPERDLERPGVSTLWEEDPQRHQRYAWYNQGQGLGILHSEMKEKMSSSPLQLSGVRMHCFYQSTMIQSFIYKVPSFYTEHFWGGFVWVYNIYINN